MSEDIPILKIYDWYSIPRNLQEHMLRAAGVSNIILKAWEGPKINNNRVITLMLLHDMGNIVKMRPKTKEDGKNIDYWEKLLQTNIFRYGTDDHIVTFNILYELGFGKEDLWLVLNKIFINNEMISNSNNFELKICAYADQVSGPECILSLNKRFSELRERYGNNPNASINHPRVNLLIRTAFEIEKQIQENMKIKISSITDEWVKKELEKLKDFTIPVNRSKIQIKNNMI